MLSREVLSAVRQGRAGQGRGLFRFGVRVRVRRDFFNVSDPGIELGDGVCDFEKVLPDQLCPLRLGLGLEQCF